MNDRMALQLKNETVSWFVRTRGLLVLLFFIVAVVSGCAKTVNGGSDGESHFLVSCDAKCEQGYNCICGVCTESCKDDESCSELTPTAICVEVKASKGCGSNDDDVVGVCDVACESSDDCSDLGSDYTCSAGFCRKEVDSTSRDVGRSDDLTIGDGEWEVVESKTTERLSAIWGFDDSDIWAMSLNSLLHYDGQSWEIAVENEQWNLSSMWGAAPDDIWAVGSSGGDSSSGVWPALIAHYDGVSWQSYDLGDAQPANGFTGVWGTSAQSVYAFQSSESRWKAPWYWDGITWKEHSAEVVYPNEEDRWSTEIFSYQAKASSTSPENVIVADFGGVVRYDGVQWIVLESGLASECTAGAAWAVSDGDFLVGKDFCGIYRYLDDGATEELDVADLSPPVLFRGFWGFSDKDIYAVGVQWQSGTTPDNAHAVASLIWHYDGQSWSKEDLGDLAVALSAIWGSPSGVVWVVGDEGTILRLRPHD